MDDLISREAAFKDLPSAKAVNAVPVAHGRWIDENPDLYLNPRMRCSVCEQVEMPLVGWNYCPNCGAKMDKEASK